MDHLEAKLGELDAQIAALKEKLSRLQGPAEGGPETEALADQTASGEEWGSIEHQLSRLQAELVLIKQGIEQNDAEIDALQSAAQSEKRPWWRDISTLIGVLAFVFSFATTMVSYGISAQQRIADDRAELRGFMQRLVEINKEQYVLQADPSTASASGAVAYYLTYETTLLVYQAIEVMDRIPNRVTANEYNLVAEMLNGIGDYNQAYRLLQQAVKVATHVNEKVSALHGLGMLYYATGNPEAGAQTYRQALGAPDRDPSMVPAHKDWMNAQTEVHWAGAELAQGNCAEAQAHMQTAHELVDKIEIGVTQVFLSQLQNAQVLVDACVPSAE